MTADRIVSQAATDWLGCGQVVTFLVSSSARLFIESFKRFEFEYGTYEQDQDSHWWGTWRNPAQCSCHSEIWMSLTAKCARAVHIENKLLSSTFSFGHPCSESFDSIKPGVMPCCKLFWASNCLTYISQSSALISSLPKVCLQKYCLVSFSKLFQDSSVHLPVLILCYSYKQVLTP